MNVAYFPGHLTLSVLQLIGPAAMVYPIVVVQNMSDAEINLMEAFHLSPPGSYSYTIKLPPHGHREFPADKFQDRNLCAGRPSAIIPFVNGVKDPQFLSPQHFKLYVKITLSVDDKGKLVIKGIKPKFTDFGRFWGCGVFFGRHYRGREEQEIR